MQHAETSAALAPFRRVLTSAVVDHINVAARNSPHSSALDVLTHGCAHERRMNGEFQSRSVGCPDDAVVGEEPT
jgi:hypothetical protein